MKIELKKHKRYHTYFEWWSGPKTVDEAQCGKLFDREDKRTLVKWKGVDCKNCIKTRKRRL